MELVASIAQRTATARTSALIRIEILYSFEIEFGSD